MPVRAPQLPADLPWLNTPAPVSLADLRDRFVLLDFWTYGCINCLNLLPTLKLIEQKYAAQLTVIGVHTGKFAAEQQPENIRSALLKYGIGHPVIVDRDRAIWQAYAIRAWPTLVLINPQGYIVEQIVGERDRDWLERTVGRHLPTASSQPLAAAVSELSTPLAFPTGLAIDHANRRLFIADTGHHRIVVTSLSGQLQTIIGSDSAGLQDGGFTDSQFQRPQGLAWDGERLYIADTGNHCVRAADFLTGQVSTVAGSGQQSRTLFPHCGIGSALPLNAPWGLALVDCYLYISMAGAHQIWRLNRQTQQLETYLGTGAEGCVDGPAAAAAFAQPSGLATDGKRLYVADSETSCIRQIELSEAPTVRTLCGSGALFDYGDRDGVGEAVRLQHPLDVAIAPDGCLWIADTYNHKLKRLNLATKYCETVLIDLFEPAGLSSTDSACYIANANKHAIIQYDFGLQQSRRLKLQTVCTIESC
ncbi:MAG: redoxin domain-containing protein [Leptolyngbya sp. SIO4C1]|nr:redoxin domain-containing protein [Leptolyngbya sp. SIO4C1]